MKSSPLGVSPNPHPASSLIPAVAGGDLSAIARRATADDLGGPATERKSRNSRHDLAHKSLFKACWEISNTLRVEQEGEAFRVGFLHKNIFNNLQILPENLPARFFLYMKEGPI